MLIHSFDKSEHFVGTGIIAFVHGHIGVRIEFVIKLRNLKAALIDIEMDIALFKIGV